MADSAERAAGAAVPRAAAVSRCWKLRRVIQTIATPPMASTSSGHQTGRFHRALQLRALLRIDAVVAHRIADHDAGLAVVHPALVRLTGPGPVAEGPGRILLTISTMRSITCCLAGPSSSTWICLNRRSYSVFS